MVRSSQRSKRNASAGNRTRVTSMATMYSTTRPLMPYVDTSATFACLLRGGVQVPAANLNPLQSSVYLRGSSRQIIFLLGGCPCHHANPYRTHMFASSIVFSLQCHPAVCVVPFCFQFFQHKSTNYIANMIQVRFTQIVLPAGAKAHRYKQCRQLTNFSSSN
jgi:hypothetical protein